MDYKRLFFRLNEKLQEHNLTLKIHCIGGFVLEYYGLKATDDIDAFYESSEKIDQLVDEIGTEFGLGTQKEAWLNHAVGQIMSVSADNDELVIIDLSNLTVSISSLEAILIDKVQVGRAKDIPDIAKIMKYLGINRPDKLLKRAVAYNTGESDPAIILEAFSLAYGEEALKNYLRENPELLRLLR